MTSSSRCFRVFKTVFVFSLIVIPFIFIYFLIDNDKYIRNKVGKEYKSTKDKYGVNIKIIDQEVSRLTKVKGEKENALKIAKKSKPPDEALMSQLQKDINDSSAATKRLKQQKSSSKKKFEEHSTRIEKNKTGYLKYLMGLTALYWMTSLVPISPVGIFPLTIAPLMRALTVDEMIKSYMTDVNMVILTASIITLGTSSAGFSKRIAYRIMSLSGANRRLTAVLVSLISLLFSMWWVNTAVMIFMCRAIDDIVHELKEGVSYGTLGNARKDEWNETNIAVAEAKARRRSNWQVKKDNERQSEEIGNFVELTTHTKKSDEFVNPHAGGSVFIVEKDMKIIHPGAGKDTDLVELSHLPSTTSIRESYVSFGSEAKKRHDAMKHEIKHILEEYRMSLHHCAAVFCSVGGLYWTYSSTTGPQLLHKKSAETLRGITVTDWATCTFPLIVMTAPFLLFCMDLVHFGPDYFDTVFHFLKIKKSRTILPNTQITPETAKNILEIFQDKYHRLGPLTSQEKSLLTLKILTIIALLVRLSESHQGFLWDNFIYKLPVKRSVWISDSTVLAIAVIVGFIFPKNIKVFFKGPMTPQEKPLFASMLGWKPVQEYFPWGILLIVGGSVALAEAFKTTGLAHVLEAHFRSYQSISWLHQEGLLVIAMLYTMVLANCLGGTCAAIVASRYLAQVGGCYLAVPCVAATAFAFIFPVGTSTMAVASIKLNGMNSWYCLRKGLLPSVVCTFIVFLFGLFYTDAIIYSVK